MPARTGTPAYIAGAAPSLPGYGIPINLVDPVTGAAIVPISNPYIAPNGTAGSTPGGPIAFTTGNAFAGSGSQGGDLTVALGSGDGAGRAGEFIVGTTLFVNDALKAVSILSQPQAASALYIHNSSPRNWTQVVQVDPLFTALAGAAARYAFASTTTLALSADTGVGSQINGYYAQMNTGADAFIHNETAAGFRALSQYQGSGSMPGAVNGIIAVARSITTATGPITGEIGGGHLDGTHQGTGLATLIYGAVGRIDLQSSGGAADGNVTTARSLYGEFYLSGIGVTAGVITTGTNVFAELPYFASGAVTSRVTNYYGLYSQGAFNTYNATTAIAGLTLVAAGAYIAVGSQSATAASNVTNYGVFITGNGGAFSGGAAGANWALYSNSTAPSSMLGSLAVGSNVAAIGTGALAIEGIVPRYNATATIGLGLSPLLAGPRPAQQVNTTVVLATLVVGAADSSYDISANINVTVSTTVAMTVTCTYTDEANVARTLTLQFSLLGGTWASSITTAQGNIPYESSVYHVRCKAGTTLSIQTVGNVTAVTYTGEANIKQTR